MELFSAEVPSVGKQLARSPAVVLAVLLLSVVSPALSQQGDECPQNWYEHGDRCYRFSSQSMPVQSASIECQQDWATLVSVKTTAEHNFVQGVLETLSSASQDWYTSGYRESDGSLRWRHDKSLIAQDFFLNNAIKNQRKEDAGLNVPFNQIVYRYDASNRTFNWAWGRIMSPGRFICQIDKSETWRIYQQRRDFSFGTGILDPLQWRTGPNITFQSPNTLFFNTGSSMTPVVLDCQATGNPKPTYKWFRQNMGQMGDRNQWQEVTSALGSKYVVTNGRLTITDPVEKEDARFYTCEASNELGTVESNPIEVSYGYVGEFSNDNISPTPAKLYMGVEISCQPIPATTGLAYNWYKGSIRYFVRPELNPQYFLSRNGKLYISEVQSADQGVYHCMTTMVPKQGQVLSVRQAPSRISMPIRVFVQGENANTYGPDIQDRFPQFFPEEPMVGGRVEIECLAYGRLPLYYSWRREDGPMNPNVQFSDHNRRLVIPNARLEDTGVYTCIVKGDTNTATKSGHLSLKARPTFPYPLRNQHLDRDSDVTWRCSAVGVPLPTYTWYKNGQKLSSNTAEGITVVSNVLSITKVDKKHEGMYECEAKNSIGVARSSAQVRTLAIAPTFAVTPVESSKQGAEGGDVTVACRPHAAPRADIRWERNGAEVGTVLPNGDLHLSGLTVGDSGIYTCVATNSLGDARSSCTITVQPQSVFTEKPSDVTILMNETTSLPCKASFDRSKTDVVYSWSFNSHMIDFDGKSDPRDAVHYSMPYATSQEDGMLYITSAKYQHEGKYTCHVTSVTGSMSSYAYLTVQGPPGEPGGVHARDASSEKKYEGELELWWQKGPKHGFDVTFYVIEYRSYWDKEDDWTILVDDLKDSDTNIDEYPEWQGYWIKGGLSPGTAYNFRVRSCNAQVGCSPPSSGPYKFYNMETAKPIVAPENVDGGGGASGLLQIKWSPLPRSKWGGNTISYIVYYRLRDDTDIKKRWIKKERKEPFYNTVVGTDFYYLPYEVKVQAVNEKGEGPNSTVAIVYSAELLPDLQPTFVSADAINGTAGTITWIGVADTRETAHGAIGGYQINYWDEGDTLCDGNFESEAQSINIYGDATEGNLVGMEPGGDYCINLQFFNAAGMGPKTDNYYLGMNDAPPSRYPEYITVMSHGRDSVRLLWDGVTNDFGQEPIRGYKAWYWEISEDIRAATIVDFGKTFTGVIHDIERDHLYRMRMMAYSAGGDGTKSTDVYFTLGGQVRYDPLTMEIMNASPARNRSNPFLALMAAIFVTAISVLNYR